jgi:cytochrome c oxidase cbb3-type subunit 4
MSVESLPELLRPMWLVWLSVIFLGIVVWAFWPRNRAKLEGYGAIPLRDDEK